MEPLLPIILSIILSGVSSDLFRESIHMTSAAARPNHQLWCFKCMADDPEDECAELNKNNSNLFHKCQVDKQTCMVKRFSYTTSNENSTTALKMWAIERNCTKHCEEGCIVIGERTKLYACTSCCTTHLCNYGSSAEQIKISQAIFLLSAILSLIAL